MYTMYTQDTEIKKGGDHMKCPEWPLGCRWCEYLVWSESECDYICINPDYQKEDSQDEEQNT